MTTQPQIQDIERRRQAAIAQGDILSRRPLSAAIDLIDGQAPARKLEAQYPTIGDFLLAPIQDLVSAPEIVLRTLSRIQSGIEMLAQDHGLPLGGPDDVPAGSAPPSVGMRLLQRLLERQIDGESEYYDITLRNGSVIPSASYLSIVDGIASVRSGESTMRVNGPSYFFDPSEVVMVAVAGQMKTPGEALVAWGNDTLADRDLKYRLAMTLRSGYVIRNIYLLESIGKVVEVGSADRVDGGVSHEVVIDQIVSIEIESYTERDKT